MLSDNITYACLLSNNLIDRLPSVKEKVLLIDNALINVKPCDSFYNLDLMDPAAQERFAETNFHLPRLAVYEFSNAIVSGAYSIISDGYAFNASHRDFNSGALPANLFGGALKLVVKDTSQYAFTDPKATPKKINTPAILFCSQGDHMHHHWLFDVCSKLYIWDVVFNRKIKLAIPSHLKNYQRQAYK